MPTSPAREGSDTVDVIEAIKARHVGVPPKPGGTSAICILDDEVYPCDAVLALLFYERSEAARQEAQEAVREAAWLLIHQADTRPTGAALDRALAVLDSGHQEGDE